MQAAGIVDVAHMLSVLGQQPDLPSTDLVTLVVDPLAHVLGIASHSEPGGQVISDLAAALVDLPPALLGTTIALIDRIPSLAEGPGLDLMEGVLAAYPSLADAIDAHQHPDVVFGDALADPIALAGQVLQDIAEILMGRPGDDQAMAAAIAAIIIASPNPVPSAGSVGIVDLIAAHLPALTIPDLAANQLIGTLTLHDLQTLGLTPEALAVISEEILASLGLDPRNPALSQIDLSQLTLQDLDALGLRPEDVIAHLGVEVLDAEALMANLTSGLDAGQVLEIADLIRNELLQQIGGLINIEDLIADDGAPIAEDLVALLGPLVTAVTLNAEVAIADEAARESLVAAMLTPLTGFPPGFFGKFVSTALRLGVTDIADALVADAGHPDLSGMAAGMRDALEDALTSDPAALQHFITAQNAEYHSRYDLDTPAEVLFATNPELLTALANDIADGLEVQPSLMAHDAATGTNTQ